MRCCVLLLPVIVVLAVFSCSTVNREKESTKNYLIIRYINLEAVYTSVLARNEKAKGLSGEKEHIVKAIKGYEAQLIGTTLVPNREVILSEQAEKRKALESLTKEEEYEKSKIYTGINSAVKTVAKTLEADFILNIGDEVVYARKKYDVTEDVIREILSMEKRSSPVSQ